MGSDELAGVASRPADGRRSTSAVGRAVVADALRAADPALAQGAEREANWRTGYLTHFRALVEAGLAAPATAAAVAAGGLDSLQPALRARGPGGAETGLDTLLTAPAGRGASPRPCPAAGGGARAGGALSRRRAAGRRAGPQLAAWVAAGTVEPSFADAVEEVAGHPEWLRLAGRTVAVLGAGAEMGRLHAAADGGRGCRRSTCRRPPSGSGCCGGAGSAGTLLVPVGEAAGRMRPAATGDAAGAPGAAGPAGAGPIWSATSRSPTGWPPPRRAAGAGQLRLRGRGRARAGGRRGRRADAPRSRPARRCSRWPSWPRQPTSSPCPPTRSRRRTGPTAPAPAARLAGGSLRTLSGGRLLQRAYQPGADPGINDSLVAQQGPNYALAKRLQRWRATVARRDGATVSINIAPLTRTRSVVKNRVLAAAYAGAHRFGVEVFEPATSRVLMAALLVHDLHPAAARRTPIRGRTRRLRAAPGGLWRIGVRAEERARARRPARLRGGPGLTSPGSACGAGLAA